ncbi:unnamed protein product [Closterium sp. NIES-54]
MDVWGPARVRGQGHERYFLLVVDDYSRYTTVFPLRSKGDVPEVLIDWICSARRQLSESFGSDLPVLRLHSDRGGEFSSDLLRAFCRAEGIRQTFTLSASQQQNGIAERRIGMVMDVARMSMIHAAAPHFLWPYVVQYTVHQINLQPRVSLPETTPTLRWTGKVGNASAFRVWESRAFVRDTSADKLSSRAIPCVFLGFPPDARGWQFYHPTSRHVLTSQDVMFDESVSYFRLFPYRAASLPPPQLFLVSGPPPVDPLPPQGPAPSVHRLSSHRLCYSRPLHYLAFLLTLDRLEVLRSVRPSTAPHRVPLPSPPASSLPHGPDPESDSLRTARPTVTRFLATAVIDPLLSPLLPLGSSQIRHIKPFQREPEKGPKAWAALKDVHAPATAAVAVVLERQMAALRIEEDEAVEEGVQKFFDLLTRLEGADLNYSELQKNTKLLALFPESWSSLIINLNRDLPHLSLEDVKRAILQEDFLRRELASADGAGAASIGRGYGRGRGRGLGGSRFGSNNFNGGRGSGGYGSDNLGGTSKLGEHKESGAAAQKQHKGEENPKVAAEEEYGENMWGTIASVAFSNPTLATGECDWLTLHRRMGHVALPILQQLVKNEMVAGIRVKGEPDEVLGCPTCMQAKFTRFPFSSSEATAKAPLDEVVMDVVGPLKLGGAGAEYFLTIVEVYTPMTWVYVLSKKSDVAETVKTDWLPMVERQQDRLVKAICTDRGGEFLSKEFSLWLKKNGIRHSLTMPYSLAMNGIAERANRTIMEMARGLLFEAGLPKYFWPDAVRSACVAKNRALTHVGADKWVPYVEWIGRKPKVDMLRVFGCMCMALVPKHLRHNKLGAKAIWAGLQIHGEPDV